ncbi:MAG: peptide chain release factor N(5)-glutamine methyltransferase [Bacteroidaceae bacterium]|nr:peptide chain release factor N(5)-glutamine methyltransferase [Bacteroidaceae bacterium]
MGEASAITFILLEHTCNLSKNDILLGLDDDISTKKVEADVQPLVDLLLKGEPIQYVVGYTDFLGLNIKVSPSTLIPRPETAELIQHLSNLSVRSILDVGTGSGCIALALKRIYPDAYICATDISDAALDIASHNARSLSMDIDFRHDDILSTALYGQRFDLIVSNPPYITLSEKQEMERTVVDFEPATALFVPDDNPLLFYDAITHYATNSLNKGGVLAFETGRRYARQVMENMRRYNFDAEVIKDSYDNDRMVIGKKI